MNRSQIVLSSILASIIIVGACDYTPPTVTNNAGGNGQGAGGSVSATSSGQAGMGTGGKNGTSSSSGEGGTGNNGGSTASGGGEGNAGGGTNSSSSSSSSSSSGGSVNCGPDECSLPAVCCVKPGMPPTRQCTSKTECPNIVVTCDGPEDCPNNGPCCGRFDFNQGLFTGVNCEAKCGAMDFIICHPELGNANCPAGKNCTPEMFFGSGYGYCE